MRVFVLNTGRCGSVTVARACEALTNFSVAHESRARLAGDARLDYPDRHVEVDNRLSWFLGPLQARFGDAPLYVHLRRDPDLVAQSFVRRWDNGYPAGIIGAFAHGLVMRPKAWPEEERIVVARSYVDTVNANIEAFLAGKPHRMTVWLEEAAEWFPRFWERIGGEGDLPAAVGEFATAHNASA